MKEFTIATIRFNDKKENDLKAYEALTDIAKKIYNYFEKLTELNPKNTWVLEVEDSANRAGLTLTEFIAGMRELNGQNYFMYWHDNKYVFGNSRMVF